MRRGELSAFGRALNSSRTLAVLFTTLGLLVVCIAALGLWLPALSISVVLIVVVSVVLLGLGSLWWFTRKHFIEPDLAFRMWLQQVCDGDLDARINLPVHHRHHKELDFHTRNLAAALARLSADMESLVADQTLRLENQRRVLEMLLRLTDSISNETEYAVVLHNVAEHLAHWFGEATVSAYQIEQDDWRRVALVSPESHQSAAVAATSSLMPDTVVNEVTWHSTSGGAGSEMVQVPFFRGADVAGMIRIELEAATVKDRSESELILQSVSEQLTLFTNKLSAREQAERVRLINERTRLAGDMHDSIAQTLLAARYKASILQETLAEAGSSHWSQDVQKIAGAIGEANQDIRELIREYRSPLADRRSIDAIQLSIQQFRESSGMDVFFQSDNPHLCFTPREESVVQRIIGEALTNAEKYANASTIRVFLQFLSDGTRAVLVEDDGQGFCVDSMTGANQSLSVETGEHIGLSIMQERALSVGAIFSIDSEPGEGTRVSLKLPPLIESEAS